MKKLTLHLIAAVLAAAGCVPLPAQVAGQVELRTYGAGGMTTHWITPEAGKAFGVTGGGALGMITVGGGAGLENIVSGITGGTLTLGGTLSTGRTLTVRDQAGTLALTSDLTWSSITSTPTTLAGYGISDGITAAAVAAGYQPLDADLTAVATNGAAYYLARGNHTGTQAWSTITSTPTTLAGYGISDGITAAAVAAGYQPLDAQLTSLAALDYTGNALKVVRVNAGENGLELATVSAGGGDMVLADAQTVSGAKTFLSSTLLMRESGGGTDTITFAAPALAGNRILTWPSSTGTLALTSQIPSLTGYMTAAAYDPQGSGYTISGATGTTTGSGAGGSGGLGPILAGGSGADSGTASALGGNGGTLAISGGNAAAAAGAAARGGHASSISVAGGAAAAVTDGSGGDYAARGGDGGVLSLQGGAGYAVGVTAIAGGDGGDLLMYGAAGESGGAAGGDVITHSGGGSINTRDFGAIQLGFAGQRTTIAGGAEADWTITLPTGPGSNGQVMTTNGSGVTSWTTVGGGSGSGWVLITSTTVSSPTTGVVFDGCFTGSYEAYQVRYHGVRAASDDAYWKFYFRDSGSDITSATVGLTYKYYGNAGPYQDNFSDSAGFRMAPYLEVGGNSSTKQVHGVVECWPRVASPKMCYIRTHYTNSNSTGEVPSMSEGHSTLSDNRTTIDGIRLFFDGVNITAGWFGVYGLKQN